MAIEGGPTDRGVVVLNLVVVLKIGGCSYIYLGSCYGNQEITF